METSFSKTKADDFFATFPKHKIVSYKEYWESVRPKNIEDIFRRYLFSYCSVHTSWKGNVYGYKAIKDFDLWIDNKEILREKLATSGVGLYNNRTEFIWDFKDQFFANPKDFYLTTKKYHIKKRNEIVKKIKGLGTAKVSFALCMINPNHARTLCGDVHMLRLYGVPKLNYQTRSGFNVYRSAEQHWSVNCGKMGVGVEIARAIYWDQIQQKEDSRYWSYVLEE